MENVEKKYGIKPNKILLVGDSAGGQLILSMIFVNDGVMFLALTLWCIKIGYRVPDILFLNYPTIDLNKDQFCPSMLFPLEDPILNTEIVRLSYFTGFPEK